MQFHRCRRQTASNHSQKEACLKDLHACCRLELVDGDFYVLQRAVGGVRGGVSYDGAHVEFRGRPIPAAPGQRPVAPRALHDHDRGTRDAMESEELHGAVQVGIRRPPVVRRQVEVEPGDETVSRNGTVNDHGCALAWALWDERP